MKKILSVKDRCPYCNKKLQDLGIYEMEKINRKYYMDWIDKKGFCYTVTLDDRKNTNNSNFYCAFCDNKLNLNPNDQFINN